jgi:TPR repeat protein
MSVLTWNTSEFFDEAEEKQRHESLANAWYSSEKDVAEIELKTAIATKDFYKYPKVASYHFQLIKEIADSDLPIIEANLAMFYSYRRGEGVESDPSLALHYIHKALKTGSNEARLVYARCLEDNQGLESVLDTDPAKALEIYRELARDSKDPSSMDIACGRAVNLLIKGKHTGELSSADEELVWQYSGDWRIIHPSRLYYDIALFYSSEIKSSGNGSWKSRRAIDLLIHGMKQSRDREVSKKCEALLDLWGAKPIAPPPPTKEQARRENAEIAVAVGFGAAGLVLWTILGIVLILAALAIDVVVSIVILAFFVIMALAALVRKKK